MFHDLSRWVDNEGGESRITAEGVVLIDEVDAHLHPLWQREIGFRLRRVFPRMQFIVTSHSPFVAQAASDRGLFVLRSVTPEGAVEAQRPLDSVKGWRVDQILTSPLFGLDATRDEETESLIRRHADLIAKRTWGKLTKDDEQQLAQLTDKLDDRLTAPGETVEERELQAETAAFIKTTLKELKAKK
jgi:predicted ATP-binding protein involved in virulence